MPVHPNSEICLLATREQPTRRAMDMRRLIVSPVRDSRKPEEIYGRVERLFDGPYLQIGARDGTARPGWTIGGQGRRTQTPVEISQTRDRDGRILRDEQVLAALRAAHSELFAGGTGQ